MIEIIIMASVIWFLAGLAAGIFGFRFWIIRRFRRQYQESGMELQHIAKTIPPGTGAYSRQQGYQDGLEYLFFLLKVD